MTIPAPLPITRRSVAAARLRASFSLRSISIFIIELKFEMKKDGFWARFVNRKRNAYIIEELQKIQTQLIALDEEIPLPGD